MDHNQLSSLAGLDCPSLTELSLHHNQLTRLPDLTHCSNLATLDLGENR